MFQYTSRRGQHGKDPVFSIYLLKEGYDATNALREDHVLADNVGAPALPEGATLFVLDSEPRPPWWRLYSALRKILLK